MAQAEQAAADTASRVIKCVADIFGREVSAETTFEELNFDSPDLAMVTFEVEGEFRIDLPDEEVEKLTTVQGLIELVTVTVAIPVGDTQPMSLGEFRALGGLQ